MQPAVPTVEGGRLYQPGCESAPILVGTPACYDWLDQQTAFTFVDQVGTFTARKRLSAAGELVWEASCTQAGMRSSLWLGPSHTLSLARLQVALTLAAQPTLAGESGESSTILPRGPGASDYLTTRTRLSRALLQTTLSRPRPSSDVIPRARLLERLNAGLSGTLTLVSTPAGSGKTTLLAQWLTRLARPSAWLSLDENDNELRLFVRSLVAALQSVFPDAFGASASLFTAAQFPVPGRVATLLLDDLADVPGDIVLGVDDYHLIHNSEVHSLLALLIELRPPQLHLMPNHLLHFLRFH